MTVLRIVSDLHFEELPYPGHFDLPQDFDVLVAAGDVWRSRPEDAVGAVAALARGKPSVMVMGNHEPWGMRIDEARARLEAACAAEGVTLLDDGEAVLAGVRFTGGTLWTDGKLGGLIDAHPDGRTGEDVLSPEGRRWSLRDAAAAHAATLEAVTRTLETPFDGPTVIVTHHAPLRECLRPGSPKTSDGLTASDLSLITDAGKAALWVHGHVHHRVDLVRPGGTRIVANPAGYAFSNPDFDETFSIAL